MKTPNLLSNKVNKLTVECAEGHHCHGFKEKLDACTARVEAAGNSEENCLEEFFDLMVILINLDLCRPLCKFYSS